MQDCIKIPLSWKSGDPEFYFILFIHRERGREGERQRNIYVWLCLMCPLLGTWPATQACALTWVGTSDLLVLGQTLNPLRQPSQGRKPRL